jgi:predicted Rossmann-fold nucleotide-binding protein
LKTIAVLGSGDAQANSPTYLVAQEAGRLLAQRGFAVATGAYGGVMEAAAKGAKEAGGTTIGYTMLGIKPNQWITQVGDCAAQFHIGFSTPPIPEIQYGLRLGSLLAADGFIIVAGGGPGTMVELLAIINLNLKLWGKTAKRLAILEVPGMPSGHWDSDTLDQLAEMGILPPAVWRLIYIPASPELAVDWVTTQSS